LALKMGNMLTMDYHSSILSMDFNSGGTMLFAGDDKGSIRVFKFKFQDRTLHNITKITVTSKPIHFIQFKGWPSNQQLPSLIVNSTENKLQIFQVEAREPPTGAKKLVDKSLIDKSSLCHLTLQKWYPLPNKSLQIRSRFCPLTQNRDGFCIVSGAEDGTLYLFDLLKKTNPNSPINKQCINLLQGHGAAVYDTAWNCDESLLASCDGTGTVIIWKRVLKPREVIAND